MNLVYNDHPPRDTQKYWLLSTCGRNSDVTFAVKKRKQYTIMVAFLAGGRHLEVVFFLGLIVCEILKIFSMLELRGHSNNA